MPKPKVFIGSSTEALHVAEAIQAELSYEAESVLWSQDVFRAMNTPIEDLIAALETFDFAIFVFFPEDTIRIRAKESIAVRDNVIFELGLFIGKLGRTRNFFLVPKNFSKEDLHLPSDFAGIIPAKYDPTASNLQAAVGSALYQIKNSIRALGTIKKHEMVLYESDKDFRRQHFEHRNSYFYKDRKRASPISDGTLSFMPDGVLHLKRSNFDGRYEIELRYNGKAEPTLVKRREPSLRSLRISCEAKSEGGEHSIRFVLKDEKADKWVGDQTKVVANPDWERIELYFEVPPTVDLLLRIDDERPSLVPSSLFLRRVQIVEEL